MPLTRGEAVGHDANLMAFKFPVSNAALGDLAGRWTGSAGELRSEFEAHRETIEAVTSEQFDQISNKETRLVRISAKHFRRGAAPR